MNLFVTERMQEFNAYLVHQLAALEVDPNMMEVERAKNTRGHSKPVISMSDTSIDVLFPENVGIFKPGINSAVERCFSERFNVSHEFGGLNSQDSEFIVLPDFEKGTGTSPFGAHVAVTTYQNDIVLDQVSFRFSQH